jgi:hypothetical protein
MSKVDTDYSNTIFYKILCKDPDVKEIYVGLTTNFVQRRHSHKQSCKNEKATNHNCKLYKTIRDIGGWDNWQMEIIGFHNCNNSYEAHKKEQEYFETLGATLNSIEPLAKHKINESSTKIIKEKDKLFCEKCNVYFSHWKTHEMHNNSKKHNKIIEIKNENKMEQNKMPKNAEKICKICEFKCCKKSDWVRHVNTTKHISRLNGNEKETTGNILNSEYNCNCGKKFSTNSGLWKHKNKGCSTKNANDELKKSEPIIEINNLIIELIKSNNELQKQNNDFIKLNFRNC